MLTIKIRYEDTYKRVTIPKIFAETMNRMRFMAMKEINLLDKSNLKSLYDYEKMLDEKMLNFTSQTIWDLEKGAEKKHPFPHSVQPFTTDDNKQEGEYLGKSRELVVQPQYSTNNDCNKYRTLHIWYIDTVKNSYLEITNDANCKRAIDHAHSNNKPLSQKSTLQSVKLRDYTECKPGRMVISAPDQFKHVSSVIDSEHLPTSIIRVKIYKNNDEDRPLGFYLREGIPDDVNSSGIYISRIVPNGLAFLTGIMQVNDQILEVNGIDVISRSINQVCEMISANSYHLVLTLKSMNHNLLLNEYHNKHYCKAPDDMYTKNQLLSDEYDSDSVIDV